MDSLVGKYQGQRSRRSKLGNSCSLCIIALEFLHSIVFLDFVPSAPFLRQYALIFNDTDTRVVLFKKKRNNYKLYYGKHFVTHFKYYECNINVLLGEAREKSETTGVRVSK
jgi:hypothetical protein